MLGKKCSLAPLKDELLKQGVPKVTHTEFCQGRTMCWALAWSFYDDVPVPSPPCKRRELEKARKALTFTVLKPTVVELQTQAPSIGCTNTSTTESVSAWLEKILTHLKVLHKQVPCGEAELSLFLTAVENTWIHARQKRREQGRHLRELPRAQPTSTCSTDAAAPSVPDTDASTPAPEEPTAEGSNAKERDDQQDLEKGANVPMDSPTEPQEAAVGDPQNPETVQCFLFKCLVNVKEEENDVVVEMHWVEGQNKDLMNQLCTCLKNSLFRQGAKPT